MTNATCVAAGARVRIGLRVTGTVQGVGFRPSVYRLATGGSLGGFVRNDSEGVWIEVEGDAETVGRFPERVRLEAPPLSRVEAVDVVRLPVRGETVFQVVASERTAKAAATIPADAATCPACLRELFDPTDRRYRYPFVNCTDCGPRYTIVRDVPYDRRATTMDRFALCEPCRIEYEDPASRRFHAEPNACPSCGPRLELVRAGRASALREDALAAAVAELRAGRILAVKGLGGFLLACDAADESAVARLRSRKRRPHKPFALMARDLETARRVVRLPPYAERALSSGASPVVLAPAIPGAAVAPSVAPGLTEYGMMLPYTPLHHLLLADGPPLLVMTSGNLSEEPIARENRDAREDLATVADAFLQHDREVHSRADDSVLRMVRGELQSVRRSRGFVPDPVALSFESEPILAVGAHLKNTVCLTRGNEAHLSAHVGDLDDAETFAFFEETIGKLTRLVGVRPAAVAHDLHPDYSSTRWALASGLPRVPVQHHHAHAASCLAEHGRTGPVIGVAFDGTGCGPAGELWGGEILVASLEKFRRVGHLGPIALAGGEAAIRQPWRLAVAAVREAGVSLPGLDGVDRSRIARVEKLLERRFVSPLSTGAGRWFDAVSALLGVRTEISYEGQAAAELEALAGEIEAEPFQFDLVPGSETFDIDLRPAVRQIVGRLAAGAPRAEIAAGFHETLVRAIAIACGEVRAATDIETVALSGGCFQNRRLTEGTARLLESDGFEVLVHRRVPPNDGGVALGQAAIAAWRLAREGR